MSSPLWSVDVHQDAVYVGAGQEFEPTWLDPDEADAFADEMRAAATAARFPSSDRTVAHVKADLEALPGKKIELEHIQGDAFLCEALRLVGQGAIADAYERARERGNDWWYR